MEEQGVSQSAVLVVPLEYALQSGSSSRAPIWLAWSALAVCGVGTVLIPIVSVETVLATGPMLFLVATFLTGISARKRRWVLSIIGIGHLAIVGLFAGLVNSFNWSPHEAAVPFLAMASVLAAAGTFTNKRIERFIVSVRRT